ncbi:MAG: DUF983 domain-containing protein [Anaerolineae bacterium]|nr:DUF983 domain-containing protein [Anaerolineae bacterium]
MKWLHVLHKLWVGLRLRCPNCEQGGMFHGLFKMEPTCPHCGVRFERQSGESIGGTLVNLVLAEMFSMGGFIITQVLFQPSWIFQLIFWVSFNILFVILFYRHARSLWVALVYLAGGVYVDPEPEPPNAT